MYTPDPDQLAAEVAGLIGDVDLSTLPAVLRRPGPQAVNQIPLTHAEALVRLGIRRDSRSWNRLRFLLRVARLARRLFRRMLDAEIRPIVAELNALRARRAG